MGAHAKHSTVATSTKASATWPGAGQAAGECDNCHEPHGKAGDPKYTRATGVAACTTCHDAAGVSYPAGYSYRGGSAYAVSPHSTSGGVSWDVLHSDSEGFSAWESTSSMTPTTPGDPITSTARDALRAQDGTYARTALATNTGDADYQMYRFHLPDGATGLQRSDDVDRLRRGDRRFPLTTSVWDASASAWVPFSSAVMGNGSTATTVTASPARFVDAGGDTWVLAQAERSRRRT